MTEKCAWVTLATNDSYCLGALVLAHSLRKVATKHNLVVLITPGVTDVMKDRLQSVFSEVITVDVLDSKDAAHLALLSRPELGITFTKIHCWTLIQYQKCVFLDADTLVFKNCDELFEREELSAAPDVGWPDCFNSGVFVFQPSNETFDALVKFAQEKGSFDGGDQGLLNQFFSGWAREDIKKHLPFAYNVCTTAFYSYLPALKQYGSDMKIMHFIGNLKPWLQKFNWSSRSVAEESHLQAPLQYWWDIFLDKVHPCLDSAMAQWECGVSNEARYQPPQDESSPFPWHQTPIPDPDLKSTSSSIVLTDDFNDPWENYTPSPTVAPAPPPSCSNDSQYSTAASEQSNDEVQSVTLVKPWYETYEPQIEIVSNEEWHDSQSNQNEKCGPGGSHCGTLSIVSKDEFDKTSDWQNLSNAIDDMIDEQNDTSVIAEIDNKNDDQEVHRHTEEMRPRHPYDNYYLIHTTTIDSHGCKRCTHEELPPAPSPSPTPSEDSDTDLQAGLAGSLSQLSIGSSEQGSAVEEHLRRQGWEAGNIDYMGADAFSNIWAKISQTLSSPPAQAPPSPPSTPAPSTPPVTQAVVPVAAPVETPVVAPPVETPVVAPPAVSATPVASTPPVETPKEVVPSVVKPVVVSPSIPEEKVPKKDEPSAVPPKAASQEAQTGAKDSKVSEDIGEETQL
ncbi:glycogenin 1 isoform X3 [Arctopsyche grandis]|uniref:glycogenin 1 isoform X3 n=1 Tax=Arctopsyche grandis TaxID=121162 RepID=UPI00406D684B